MRAKVVVFAVLGILACTSFTPAQTRTASAANTAPAIAFRIRPYAGGGFGSYSYRERSDFSNFSGNVDVGHAGYLVVGGGEVRVRSWVAIAVDVQSTHVPGILGTGDSRRAWGLVAALRTILAASAHASGYSSDTDRCDCALVSDHVDFQRTRQGTHG